MQTIINWIDPKKELPPHDTNVIILMKDGLLPYITIARYIGRWADPTNDPEWFDDEDVIGWHFRSQ